MEGFKPFQLTMRRRYRKKLKPLLGENERNWSADDLRVKYRKVDISSLVLSLTFSCIGNARRRAMQKRFAMFVLTAPLKVVEKSLPVREEVHEVCLRQIEVVKYNVEFEAEASYAERQVILRTLRDQPRTAPQRLLIEASRTKGRHRDYLEEDEETRWSDRAVLEFVEKSAKPRYSLCGPSPKIPRSQIDPKRFSSTSRTLNKSSISGRFTAHSDEFDQLESQKERNMFVQQRSCHSGANLPRLYTVSLAHFAFKSLGSPERFQHRESSTSSSSAVNNTTLSLVKKPALMSYCDRDNLPKPRPVGIVAPPSISEIPKEASYDAIFLDDVEMIRGDDEKDSVAVVVSQSSDEKKNLFVAAQCGDVETVERLLDSGDGIYVDVEDDLGNTPLLVAGRSRNKRMIKTLLRRGANINAQNGRGESLLFMTRDTPALFQYCIDKGADDSLLDCRGLTCYETLVEDV